MSSAEPGKAGWRPRPGSAVAALLAVSLNDSKPMHLILDTGADGIYLNGKAASNLRLEHLSESTAHGAGRLDPVPARRMLARSVRLGDLA